MVTFSGILHGSNWIFVWAFGLDLNEDSIGLECHFKGVYKDSIGIL